MDKYHYFSLQKRKAIVSFPAVSVDESIELKMNNRNKKMVMFDFRPN